VAANSRKQYGTPVKEVEGYLEKLLAEPEKKSAKGVGSVNPKRSKGKNAQAPKSRGSGEPHEG